MGHSPKCVLPTFAHTKVGPRWVGVLTKPCKSLRDDDRRDEMIALIFAVNPSVSLAANSLSLRLGHGAALICHWHIIHYRAATSLPLAQGSLWVCRQARRNLFSPITKKKQPFGCFFLVRVVIQHFSKNTVISMVLGHPNSEITCIPPS